MSLRVLHVVPSVSPRRGGPSKAACEMVAAQNAIGLSAEIATTNDDLESLLDVELNQQLEFNGAPVRFFQRWSPAVAGLREFQVSRSFSRWLADNIDAYDVLHVHAIFSYCSSYAMWLARKTGKPYVVRPIGQLESWALNQAKLKKQIYLALLERANLSAASRVQFTAESERRQALLRFPELNSVVVPLGIDDPAHMQGASSRLRQQYHIAADQRVLCYLGRLHQKKGIDLLLKAIAKLETPCHLLIAGSGSESVQQSLHALITSLDISDRVQFVGFVSGEQKQLLLQGSDLFALTSWSENFGISVLEALAAGTPALVTEGVALSSTIKEHSLGFVAEPSVESICSTLESGLRAVEAGNIDCERIREFIRQHYQWPEIARQLQQMYASLVS